VGVVVLHALQFDPFQLQRVLGRQVLGVQVVGDHLGLDREQASEVPDPLGEGAEGLVVLQIADVMGDEGVAALGQAEGVLELGPAGQDVPRERPGQPERLGREPPRASQGQLAPPERPHHRVVGPDVDRAVVDQEPVGDPPEPLQRLVVPVGDRLVGHVPAGQHDRASHLGQQQVVQRRVRQHHPQRPVLWRHRPGDRRRGPPP
jgi:hypothetical protein